jgi:hypothetical protein
MGVISMQSRKHTAWRKNRRFGDVHGGRSRKKFSDNIFQRTHSLQRPNLGEALPLVIEENPSRYFFFPLSGADALRALKALPAEDYAEITHIWLRRIRKADYESGELPLAEFVCGSGVRAVVLYPWPVDRKLRFGEQRPTAQRLREYARWQPELRKEGMQWVLVWDDAALRSFYVEHLLYHEVGHHVDWYRRHWSKANTRLVEEVAGQYAMSKTQVATYILNRLAEEGEND